MSRVALDSNVLIYAEFEPGTTKGIRARTIIEGASKDGVIPLQVYGDFLHFAQRRKSNEFGSAFQWVTGYRSIFLTSPTTDAVFNSAVELANVHKFQFWDAVICAASLAAGASVLLSEDMQDGRMIDGLRLINPFLSTNAKAVEAIFAD